MQKVLERYGKYAEGIPVEKSLQCPDPSLYGQFIEGKLPPDKSNDLQLHISTCRYCIRQTGQAVGSLDAKTPHTSPPERVLRFLADAYKKNFSVAGSFHIDFRNLEAEIETGCKKRFDWELTESIITTSFEFFWDEKKFMTALHREQDEDKWKLILKNKSLPDDIVSDWTGKETSFLGVPMNDTEIILFTKQNQYRWNISY